MAMLRLAANGETPLIFDPAQGRDAPPLTVEAARAAAPALRKTRPLVVMVHGYKFDPYDGHAANPHDYLYHFDPRRAEVDRWRRPASWPLGLGFNGTDTFGIDGLCVGFAWSSKPQVRFGRFCAAYLEAERAGRAMLKTLSMLAEAFPHRDIRHSHPQPRRTGRPDGDARGGGGTPRPDRADRARDPARPRRDGRVGPRDHARHRPGGSGQASTDISVVARENDVFDVMAERFAPNVGGVRPICLGATGLGRDRDDWLDLQLDSPALLEWLKGRGVEIGGGTRRACHWGVYNRPGALEFYAAILRERAPWAIPAMRAAGMPTQLEQRWARWRGPRFRLRRRGGALAEVGSGSHASASEGTPVVGV